MKEYTIKIEPHGTNLTSTEGTLLLDILNDAGIPLQTPCGGRGTCGKCTVTVTPRRKGSEPFTCLACTTPLEEDITIQVEKTREEAEFTVPGDIPAGKDLVLAIDIGTTTIQFALTEKSGNETWHLPTVMNPQRRYGHDVIARIAAAADPEKRKHLTGSLRRTIAFLLERLYRHRPVLAGAVEELVIAGNTAMTYFFFGIDTSPLGTFPYLTSKIDFDTDDIHDSEKTLPDIRKISALPVASAFLGGDLVGALALTGREGIPDNTLFFDIGTNGEMFLTIGGGEVYATSCAMGPALEGMNISRGMTAAPGAINHFYLTNNRLHYNVINDIEPVGISGTALVDALSLFLEYGLMARSGSIKTETTCPDGVEVKNLAFHIGKSLAITQKDIRAIQLARAASFAAARILMKEAGLSPGEIKKVIIAGSFGENLSLEHFKNLHFLPALPRADYTFAGNTSLAAALAAARDVSFIEHAEKLRDRLHVIDLASHPDFNETYLAAMDF